MAIALSVACGAPGLERKKRGDKRQTDASDQWKAETATETGTTTSTSTTQTNESAVAGVTPPATGPTATQSTDTAATSSTATLLAPLSVEILEAAPPTVKIGQGYLSAERRTTSSVCVVGDIALQRGAPFTTVAGKSLTSTPGDHEFGTALNKYVSDVDVPALKTYAEHLKLGPNDYGMREETFVTAGSAWGLRNVRRIDGASDCGDQFIRTISPAAFFGFGFKIEFPEPADAAEFDRLFRDTLQHRALGALPLPVEVAGFLSGRAHLRLIVLQGGGDLEETRSLVGATTCSTSDIAACNDLLRRLGERARDWYDIIQRQSPSIEAATPGTAQGWGVFITTPSDNSVAF
jgi:hypothetical protein